LLRLNRAAVFLGLNANLPWFMAPWYTATTIAAAWALVVELPPDLGAQVSQLVWLGPFDAEFWRGGAALVRPLLAPFLIGPTIGAVGVSAASFPVAHALTARHRRKPDAPEGSVRRPDLQVRQSADNYWSGNRRT
jgi:hypothetical protein